ncbi:MAG: S4 domain-containing protein [Candidatus Methanoperedens sp.]|nr:S4 domain-containing protein [Candidatus Methanoperedens sp.]
MARHQKRVAAPTSWPITRKTHHWVVGANAGSHSKGTGIPLLVVVRDMLKIANTSKEAKTIINEGNILVDGVERTNYKHMVGLFDIVSIPTTNEYYRVLQHD